MNKTVAAPTAPTPCTMGNSIQWLETAETLQGDSYGA